MQNPVPGKVVTPFPLADLRGQQATLRCPGDKSLTHRAIIFAAMAKGESIVEKPLLGADCLSTMAVFRELGVRIDNQSAADRLVINSLGWDAWQTPKNPLDFGNSGTTARLLIGVFAATPGLKAACIGDASLSARPMARVVNLMRRAGAHITGRDDGNLLPLTIEGGNLKPLNHVVDKSSAQIKSAVILAGLNTEGVTSVRLPKGGRDHTERILRKMAAKIKVTHEGREELISVTGRFRPQAMHCTVPADPSSAAFFAVLAALTPGFSLTLKDVLNNPTRCGFVAVLKRMGVAMSMRPTDTREAYLEEIYDIEVSGGDRIEPTEITPEEVPTLIDEIPVLAVLAAFADGASRFRDLGELRVKESDRLQLTAELLRAAGAKVSIDGDDLLVAGGLQKAQAFTFAPHGDHRLAMAAAILATRATGPCTILDPGCVEVSFPGFFPMLASLRP